MGHRLDSLADRQRSDLTTAASRAEPAEDGGAAQSAIRLVVLTLLAVDGILSAVAGALLLPSYVGSFPFPISGLVSGLVNAALVWAARGWTKSSRVAALPLWMWLLTVAVMSLGIPHDDVILGGQGVMAYGALVLIVLGVTPPALVLWWRGAKS
ncbi:hypothetical protein [Mycobacterium sp.]|uniref:hypothetical protein n=1 Tax=Mycobacterium sp. TaxID=1785 RepID=UPI003BAD9FE7